MTKITTLMLPLCVLIICSLTLFASCDWLSVGGGDNPGVQTPGGQTPLADEHDHVMVKTDEVPASCKNTGTEEYYTCSDCGKLFSDAEGMNEIPAPVTLDKLSHDWSDEEKEDENGFYVECTECDEKKQISPTEADSYSAVKDNEFVSDKSCQLEMHYGSNGVSHNGGNDKSDVEVGFMGGIDNVGEYVSYQFVMSSAGTADLVWTVAGNRYSSGQNLGISDMAEHMSVTVDGKPVDVSGIELPAVNGDDYNEMWWKLQQVVIKDVKLDAGVHIFKCEVIKKGGVNIDDLKIYATKSVANDLKVSVVSANLKLEDGKVLYLLTYDVQGYAPSDFEFFNGTEIYPFTTEREGTLLTFKFDFTGHVTGRFYPHMRLKGENYGHKNGDVLLPENPYNGAACILDCVKYKIVTEYDMPCVDVSVSHDYTATEVTLAPTTTSEGKAEVHCSGCGILYDLAGEIALPVLSAENGYEVTEGAITRYTYLAKVFTDLYAAFVFNFDVEGAASSNNQSFSAYDAFSKIGSTEAEYNENGYYIGKEGDSFILIIKAAGDTAASFTLTDIENNCCGASVLSSITVNGRASETHIVGDSIVLVLEKGTNTIVFTLSRDVNLASIAFGSDVTVSLIDPANAYNLTLMSYNIRLETSSDTEFKNWDQRKTYLVAHILDYSPDIVCFQEVKQTQYSDLVTLIGEIYEIVWYGRETSSNPEGVAVAYKKAEFTEIERGMFWLSETPEVESIGWDAYMYKRIAANVILKHNASGQMLNVFSVHLDAHQREACYKALELVMSRAAEHSYPVYIAGDFNATDVSYAYGITDAGYHDAKVVSPITDSGYTGSGWFGAGDRTGRPIDHIFISPEYFVPTEYYILRDTWGENYFHSDHFALLSKVILLK